MNIKPGIDLGEAFEKLKNDFRKAEEMKENYKPAENKYAAAYGSLSASVQTFLFWNTDAPTMESIRQDDPNDIPNDLFTQPNGHGALAD